MEQVLHSLAFYIAWTLIHTSSVPDRARINKYKSMRTVLASTG
jgi:hypothetical protein